MLENFKWDVTSNQNCTSNNDTLKPNVSNTTQYLRLKKKWFFTLLFDARCRIQTFKLWFTSFKQFHTCLLYTSDAADE